MNEQANVKTMQAAYDAFSQGDIPAVFSFLAEDAEYIAVGPADVIPWAGTYHGHAQIGQFFTRLGAALEFLSFSAEEFIAQGDKLAVVMHGRYKARSTGKEFETNPQHIVTFRDGKVVQLISLDDTATIAAMLAA